jgi:hypothetical protein
MHELIAFVKIVSLALLMILILLVMTISLLSIMSDDMKFGKGTIELRKGRIVNIMMKLGICGVTFIGYFVMMVLIR